MYLIFIIKKKHRVDLIADRMKVHRDSLYRWIRADKPFPVDQLASLINATEDVEFLEYFADQCGYSIMPKIKDKKTAKVVSQMAKIMLSATDEKNNE